MNEESNKKIKVKFFMDDTYEVVEVEEYEGYEIITCQLFCGSLADCEAYIRLTENGYL